MDQFSIDLRRAALIASHDSKVHFCSELDLVNILRLNPALKYQLIGTRHDLHQDFARSDDCSGGVDPKLMGDAGLRCADFLGGGIANGFMQADEHLAGVDRITIFNEYLTHHSAGGMLNLLVSTPGRVIRVL